MGETVYTYLLKSRNEYKIGQSIDPEKRLKQLQTGNTDVRMIAYGKGITESGLHKKFAWTRVKGEWFKLKREDVETIIRLLKNDYEVKPDSESYNKKLGYVIKFGKYKGRVLNTMTSKEELSYLNWFINNSYMNNKSMMKILRWWLVEMGYTTKWTDYKKNGRKVVSR